MNDNSGVGGDVWAYGANLDSTPELFMQVVFADASEIHLSDYSYFIETSATGWPDHLWALYDYVGPSEVRMVALARGDMTVTVLTPVVLSQELMELVLSYNLNSGIENAFDSKLENALMALDRVQAGDDGAAISILYAFIYSVEAQRGNALSNAQADELASLANNMIRTIENQ
jgi:hypothetical protein